MIRAVVDTSLLVTYQLTHRPPMYVLLDHHLALDDRVLVAAPELLAELEQVLAYPKSQLYYSEGQSLRMVALMMTLSEVLDLLESIPRICRGPDGDQVIACAVAGEAGVIGSGDQALLALEDLGGMRMLTTAQFLEVLRLEGVGKARAATEGRPYER